MGFAVDLNLILNADESRFRFKRLVAVVELSVSCQLLDDTQYDKNGFEHDGKRNKPLLSRQSSTDDAGRMRSCRTR